MIKEKRRSFKEVAEDWEGYNLTYRCNKNCLITKEDFNQIIDEEITNLKRKFNYYYKNIIRDKLTFNIFFRDVEPCKEPLFAICYTESGIIKLFKKNICTHNKHIITKEFRGQVFNILLHESLHTIFGPEEKIVTMITHRIGKFEGKEYNKNVKEMKND